MEKPVMCDNCGNLMKMNPDGSYTCQVCGNSYKEKSEDKKDVPDYIS